jgi:DNA-directed RNA polymerase subunit beta
MQELKKVVNFGKIKSKIDLPNLIEIQLTSYEWFLQSKVSKKKSQGLQSVFEEIFPIESPHDDVVLEFVNYEIGEPKYSEYECKERDVTFAAPLKATIRLIRKDSMEVREQFVYMGDIPLMTERGTFIINGAERVVVNQLHRSPGIFFFYEEDERVYNSRVIPDRGSWLEFEMDNKGYIVGRIDRKKKFPVTLLIKAMGFETNNEIVKLFYNIGKVKLKSEEDYEILNGRRVASDVISKSTGEVIIEAAERINIDIIDRLKEEKVSDLELIDFPNNKEDAYLSTTFQVEPEFIKKNLRLEDGHEYSNSDLALLALHSVLRPGEPTNLDNAKAELERLFFSPRSYSLSSVGRYKINSKFGFDEEIEVLTKNDIIHTVKYILYLIAEADGYEYEYAAKNGKKEKKYVYTIVDDIDHLGNRRVRSVGELIMNQIKVGFQRMERVIKERMTIQDLDVITPQALISIKPITAVINEFFGSSQLSQFMDQTNPLAELTHKRRLNALGPGGLSRERAGFEVRDVHPSHYGRMCPIETPEGPNIGLIVSLSTYGRINDYGFLETPYRYVEKGRVTDKIEYLTANIEDNYSIAQANAELDDQGNFIRNLIPCRNRGNFPYKRPKEIQYMDVSPEQIFSVSTCLIPFLEHDDANRALMGSNMQRQAVPLLTEDAPLVGTGMEPAAAYDSGVLIIAKRGGEVVFADGSLVKVKTSSGEIDDYILQKFKRTNQSTCFNQKPAVREGQRVRTGDIIADGPATDNGRLALGKNILVAFMPWMGYNFEDAILLSERLVKEDVYTSVHIEQFEMEARETKLGREVITRDIPNLNDKRSGS